MRNMQRQTWKTIIGASDKVLNGIIDLIAPNKVCILIVTEKSSTPLLYSLKVCTDSISKWSFNHL